MANVPLQRGFEIIRQILAYTLYQVNQVILRTLSSMHRIAFRVTERAKKLEELEGRREEAHFEEEVREARLEALRLQVSA